MVGRFPHAHRNVTPDVWTHFRRIAATTPLLLARGLLQRQHTVALLLTDQLEDLSFLLPNTPQRSRDFH